MKSIWFAFIHTVMCLVLVYIASTATFASAFLYGTWICIMYTSNQPNLILI